MYIHIYIYINILSGVCVCVCFYVFVSVHSHPDGRRNRMLFLGHDSLSGTWHIHWNMTQSQGRDSFTCFIHTWIPICKVTHSHVTHYLWRDSFIETQLTDRDMTHSHVLFTRELRSGKSLIRILLTVLDVTHAYAVTCSYVCDATYLHACTDCFMSATHLIYTRIRGAMHTYMYICMYVYMYIHMYIYMYTSILALEVICIYICIYVCMYIYIYTYVYIHVHICIYIRTHLIYTRIRGDMYIYMYIHMYVYICIHMYIYMYTPHLYSH